MKSGVYMIINIINNKMYIGSTVNYTKRRSAHISGLRRECHGNHRLQSDFNIYGEDSFKMVLLCEAETESERFEIEESIIRALKTYENGYNLTVDGRGKYLLTDKTRKLMSENSKGENNPFYGKKHTEESLIIMSEKGKTNNKGENNPFHGKTHTEETLEKIAKTMEKKRANGWNPLKDVPKTKEAVYNNTMAQSKRKPVHAEGKDYISSSACAKDLIISGTTVRNRVNSDKFPDYYYIDK